MEEEEQGEEVGGSKMSTARAVLVDHSVFEALLPPRELSDKNSFKTTDTASASPPPCLLAAPARRRRVAPPPPPPLCGCAHFIYLFIYFT